jgi:hypothetical protein
MKRSFNHAVHKVPFWRELRVKRRSGKHVRIADPQEIGCIRF